MKNFNIRILAILFALLIILLALSVYIKPILETFGTITLDISGVPYTGQVRQNTSYEIDVSGVKYTGTIDGSFNQPQIVNENNVYVGTSGAGGLNDIYLPGSAATSGGNYSSPLDFMTNYFPSSGMYTDVSGVAGTLLPNADDVAGTNYSIPEAEESMLGTLGVDYYKCMEGDHVPAANGQQEEIGTYFYVRNYGGSTPFLKCDEHVPPCNQFNNNDTGVGSEDRCIGFTSRAGRQLCDYTPHILNQDGVTVDVSSNCAPRQLDPPYFVDAPAPTGSASSTPTNTVPVP